MSALKAGELRRSWEPAQLPSRTTAELEDCCYVFNFQAGTSWRA